MQVFFLRNRLFSRSREGAWIEIKDVAYNQFRVSRRSREGAWIEISHAQYLILT